MGEYEGVKKLSSDINFGRAQEAFDAKEYDKVLTLLRQNTSEEARELKKEVNYIRGKLYYDEGKFEEAMSCFNAAYNFKDAKKLYTDSQAEYNKIQIANLSIKAKEYNLEINEDVIGWLYLPNTGIDYPVMKSSNVRYDYLKQNIYKQHDFWGSLVADYECNFSAGLPTNTIIYGNNFTNTLAPYSDNNPNDKMFAEIHKYVDEIFAKDHTYIYFATPEKSYKYQVFAAFYTHQSWTDYIYAYPNANRLSNIINTATEQSLYDFNVDVGTNDKIISLSTGTNGKGNTSDYRFVVMGKLISE